MLLHGMFWTDLNRVTHDQAWSTWPAQHGTKNTKMKSSKKVADKFVSVSPLPVAEGRIEEDSAGVLHHHHLLHLHRHAQAEDLAEGQVQGVHHSHPGELGEW